MKNLYIPKILYFCLVLFLSSKQSFSCNLSNYTLTTITGTGPYTITTQLCVGAGITGAVRGADANTRDILFGFYSNDPTFSITSFSPLSITGFSTCTMDGIITGAILFDPFNVQDGVYYADPGTAPCATRPYACINTTALCGNVAQQCTNFTFVTNVLPDSIRVFGVEGDGNPIAGCYPNPDMLINFNALLPVFWSTVNARKINEKEVLINWTTLSEIDNYFFTVEKTDELASGFNHHNQQTDETVWTQCGIVNGTNTNSRKDYSFIDNNLISGLSYYRIKQTDFSGKFSYSKIVVLSSFSENEILKVYPNPSKNILTVEYDGLKSIFLLNMLGEKIYEMKNIENNLLHTFSTQNFSEGMYVLKIIGWNNEVVSHKIEIIH
jgi:hypothetical protein